MADVTRAPLPGGALPSISDLLQDTMADLTDDMGPYVLAGLGQLVITIPLVMVFVLGLYFFMFVVMFGVMLGGAAGSALAGNAFGDTAGTIGIVLTQLGTIGSIFVVIAISAALLGAVLAPINASLARSIADYQRGGAKPEFNAAFRSASKSLGKTLGIAAIMALLTVFLLMFCYLPALLIPVVFSFATSLVYLHDLSPVAALRTAVQHFRAHPGWHVQYGLLSTALYMVAGYVPLLGPMFMLALQVRAYRSLFGDGDEVVLT